MGRMLSLLLFVLLVGGGYLLYTHWKQEPPAELIEVLTKTDPPPPLPSGDRAPLRVHQGFIATIYSRDIPNARVMVRDPKGTMVVSQTKDGKVAALPDLDSDGKADRTVTILEGLSQPHGLAFICEPDVVLSASAGQDGCTLYIAETGALRSYTYDADTYSATSSETLTTFPVGDGHFTRTLLPTPDNRGLYISVGSSCNVCIEEDARRATVLLFDIATKKVTTVATGLRNTVFMAYDPVTGKLWGTDNGRDVIGDDIPSDEVNIIEKGKDYGWPLCYGNNVHDTDFDKKKYETNPCSNMAPPHIELQAHSAALGLAFVPEEGWPEDMWNDLIIAYHGSWNRSTPTGYKVVRFDLDDARDATSGPIDLLTGFLAPGEKPDQAIGRPVGLLIEPGGVLYVSDDRAGAIYRVSRTEE